jgi:hypothetical protein
VLKPKTRTSNRVLILQTTATAIYYCTAVLVRVFCRRQYSSNTRISLYRANLCKLRGLLENFHQICIHQIKVTGKKVKCTPAQALRLCTGRTAHRVSRGQALPFHDHGTRRWSGVSVTPRPLFTPGKDPILTVQEAGWAPGPVWTGAENLAPNGIRSPDRTARSQSLYRLRYPANKVIGGGANN